MDFQPNVNLDFSLNYFKLGANTKIRAKTMLNSGEKCELFYICFFLDILKWY